jgi:RNA polymerase sigma-70 factor (ECF subfamily)
MEATDEQLMLAYAAGDPAAFETLYARHKGGLYRFVLRGIKERGIAEELFQEIWMRVIEARLRYAPQARFSTWLYTIAHNRMVDHWRKRGLHVVSLERDDPDDPAPPEPAAQAAREPQRQAETNQQLERLARALEALPPAQREVFLMREEGGLSLTEIASATASNEEAVKSRLRYAVAKLREALDG